VERGDFDLAAERSGGEADRHLAMQVVAVAFEHRVPTDVDFDVEDARRPTVDAGFAVAAVAQTHAVVDAGGNLHFQRLVALDPAGAVACAAGVGDHPAGAVALGTSLLDREEALLHADLASSAAGGAGLRLGTGLGAAAVAGF